MNFFKKHRGLKRYYRNLAKATDFDKFTWLDFGNPNTLKKDWHLHFDRYGYGEDSFKRRKPHLDKLFRHFDILVDRTKDWNSDFQLYAILLDFDSLSDALFFHILNPTNSRFTFKVSDLQLATTLTNNQLNNYLNNLDGYEKLYGKADEAFCLIFKKNVGHSF
jgi:hypothetical protein